MAISFDKVFGVHQYTMGLRTQRAEILASNLANADTPGYKARDLDFDLAFMEATGLSQGTPQTMTTSNEKHISHAVITSDDEDLTIKYRLPYQADTGNGNSVEVSSERMKYLDNTLEYQATLTFLNGRISSLKKALSTGS